MAELLLEQRLVTLGEAMTFPDADSLADDVLGELAELEAVVPIARPMRRRWLLTSAAVLLAVALIVGAVPASRRAVARWLGFENFRIEPVVELPVIPDDAATSPSDPLPGPGVVVASTVVDGASVLVAELPGTLDAGLFTKKLGRDTTVTAVSVGGDSGFWLAGAPHTLLYEDERGDHVEARVAGNVLVWQHGRTIRRVEGASTLEAALEVAARAW